MTDFTAQITYQNENGDCVHSDMMTGGDENHRLETFKNDEYRKFLHDALDEWLNNSKGTGYFHIGEPKI